MADERGITALSMRSVGERLGRTAMALYTYVPSRNELVDLMCDQALAELPANYGTSSGWRSAVIAWANYLWRFYLRHPWILQVSSARPVLGPNEFRHMETIAKILQETGLAGRNRRAVIGVLSNFIRGVTQMVAEMRQAAGETGVSDDQWWYARSAELEHLAPDFSERFPALSTLEGEKAFQPRNEDEPYLEQEAKETFEVGLSVLLDGVETILATK